MSKLGDLYTGLIRLLEMVDLGLMPIVGASEEASHVRYSFANGYTIRVFNDAGDWNYIDSIQGPPPDSALLNLWKQHERLDDAESRERLKYWCPSGDRLETIWHWSRVTGGETMSPAPD